MQQAPTIISYEENFSARVANSTFSKGAIIDWNHQKVINLDMGGLRQRHGIRHHELTTGAGGACHAIFLLTLLDMDRGTRIEANVPEISYTTEL